VWGTQGDSYQNGKIPFASATEVNYEPPASTQLVLSVNYLMERSYEDFSSIKMSDLFMHK